MIAYVEHPQIVFAEGGVSLNEAVPVDVASVAPIHRSPHHVGPHGRTHTVRANHQIGYDPFSIFKESRSGVFVLLDANAGPAEMHMLKPKGL